MTNNLTSITCATPVKRHLMLLLSVIAVFLISASLQAESSQWMTDLDAALEASADSGKPVLIDFSGSDWCGWCMRLDREVFSKKVFLDWAQDNVILCIADFPRDKSKMTEEQQQKNRKAAQRYNIKGFPTVLLLDKNGKVIRRTGYQQGGPEAYIQMLKKYIK